MTKHIYNPAGFDPRSYLPPGLHRYAAAARYLVHAIECQRVFSHRTRSAYNPLKAAYLKNVMGKNYGKVRDMLMEAGVVECDGHYVQGKKSLAYRLGPAFTGAVFERLEASSRLARKMTKHSPFIPNPRTPVHRWLLHWLQVVELDYEGAVKSLSSSKEVINKKLPLDWLHNREFIFTVDDYHRVHTNITSLAKSLRSFLSFFGQKLVMLDITNSQPFFLSVLLVDWYRNRHSLESFSSLYSSETGALKRATNDIIKDCFLSPGEGRAGTVHYDAPFASLAKRLSLFRNLPSDVFDYVRMTEQGDIYECLADVFGVNARQRAKDMFIKTVMYMKSGRIPAQVKFQEKFPNVYEVMVELKRKDYRRFAHLLQRAEAAFVIHRVCERIMREVPEMPILTIHDCLLTTAENQSTLASIFREETRSLGLTPRTKLEVLEPGNCGRTVSEGNKAAMSYH